MFKYFLSAIALLYPYTAISEQAVGPVASVTPLSPDWKSIIVSTLDNQIVGVKKAGQSYYFTPTPVVDWAGFSIAVVEACENNGDTDFIPVELKFLNYHPLVLTEIAQKAGIDLNALTVVPHFGRSVFLRDLDQNNHMISTSLDMTTLLQGEAMNVNHPLPATERLVINQPCALLRQFANIRSLTVSYHAQGEKFETASINAEVLMSQAIDTFFDTSDAAEQVDRTSITNSSGGTGFAIDLGPLSFNKSDAEQVVVRSNVKYRAVDRNWVSGRAEETLQSIEIEEVCGQKQGCLEEELRKMIVDFALSGAEQRRIDFRKNADDQYDVFIGQTNVGKTVFNVDESVKATLDTIFDNSTEEEQSGEFAGFKGTYKKKDENTLTINGNSEYTKQGEEWIPTSLTLSLVDTTKVQDRVRTGYARTVLQGKALVSYRAQNAAMGKIPASFIEGKFYDLHQTALADLATANQVIAGEPGRRAAINSVNFAILQGEGVNGQFPPSNGHLHLFDSNHYKVVNCSKLGGPVVNQAYFQSLCGASRRPYAVQLISHGGRTCGYNLWSLACVAK